MVTVIFTLPVSDVAGLAGVYVSVWSLTPPDMLPADKSIDVVPTCTSTEPVALLLVP